LRKFEDAKLLVTDVLFLSEVLRFGFTSSLRSLGSLLRQLAERVGDGVISAGGRAMDALNPDGLRFHYRLLQIRSPVVYGRELKWAQKQSRAFTPLFLIKSK